jgi:hypothetical protein
MVFALETLDGEDVFTFGVVGLLAGTGTTWWARISIM